jgi:hypothetical protein
MRRQDLGLASRFRWLVVVGLFGAGVPVPSLAASSEERAPLRLEGAARWSGSWLELSAGLPGSAGAARLADPQSVALGFESTLSLRLDRSGCLAGDCGAGSVVMALDPVAAAAADPSRRLVLELRAESAGDRRPALVLPGGPAPRQVESGPAIDLADGNWHTVDVLYRPGSLEVMVDGGLVLAATIDVESSLRLAGRSAEVSLESANGGGSARFQVRDWRWLAAPPAPAADGEVEPLAAHPRGLALVPKVFGLGYAADVHGFWTAQGCTGCHTGGGGPGFLDLSGSASTVYPRVDQSPRVDLGNPAASLILTKPQPGTVSHGGGDFNCFIPGNSCYDTILHWIQDGAPFAPCSYSISPPSRSHTAAGGSNSVAVTAGTGCSWTATSNRSYIHVTSGASGSGNGTVNYTVDANTGAARSGAIAIADQSFAISQAAAAACNYSLDSTSAAFGSAGGNGMVGVTTTAGCNWTGTSNDSWITVTGGSPHSGSGNLTYSVAANGGAAQRSGSLTIAGSAFTVNEAGTSGAPCVASATKMCLNANRFEVSAIFRINGGSPTAAHVVKLTDDTGYFWFFAATNVEAVLKVLNACTFNSRYWVYAGGLTDVEVTISVRDSHYVNPLNTRFQPIQDSSAFATCP